VELLSREKYHLFESKLCLLKKKLSVSDGTSAGLPNSSIFSCIISGLERFGIMFLFKVFILVMKSELIES
jgi:hypothetical protein